LLVSPCAFWMSAVKPAAVNAAVRAGRSPFSHRGDDAESGRMTQALLGVAAGLLLVLLPPDAHPLSSNAEAETTTATEIHEEDFISLPF